MDYENVIEGLKDAHIRAKNLGDAISSIAELTNDVEMKAVITDLANSAYNLAMDVQDAGDTYIEIQQEEAEDIGDTEYIEDGEELEPSEPEA